MDREVHSGLDPYGLVITGQGFFSRSRVLQGERLAQMDRGLVPGTYSGIFRMSLKSFINYSNYRLLQLFLIVSILDSVRRF